jgi:CheY-like chemotaxis protein/two-component sensor histidine kinase
VPSEEGKLAASLAHEINNPLDSLLSLLCLIKAEATFTEKGSQYLALAEEEVQRISQIAHAALHEYGETDGRRDANVPRLVGSVVDFYRSRFEARGISVNTRYCGNGDLPIYAGPLRQVFSNLLLNAADAMPKGGQLHARASIAREWSGRQRHGLRVTFADNGGGIAAKNLHKIFDPFFTTKGSGGSGLGLSLVKDVVQKHDGSLHVRSSTKLGRSGSIFAIFLPDGASAPTSKTRFGVHASPRHQGAAMANTAPVKPTLLVVDDNQTALHVRQMVLESAGYTVLVARDSATAIALFSSSAVDMVVSDHFLQDCTGIELAAAMKKLKPEVPIVIISGLVDAPDGIEHADLFISKADSPPQILQKISELLKRRN